MHHVQRCCRVLAVAGLLACAMSAAPARADEGSVITMGSSFGLSFLIPESGDNVTVFSAPTSAALIATGPGLRFGFVNADRDVEAGFDVGVWWASSNGESSHQMMLGVDFEKHFPGGGANGPFVGLEGGFASQDLFAEGTQGYLGAALGVRHIVGDDNGGVKFAVRGRHLFETSDLASYTVVDLSVAFDLWIPSSAR